MGQGKSTETQTSIFPLFERTSQSGDDVSVYVKGFNSRSTGVAYFDSWSQQHQILSEQKGWSPDAFGYHWSPAYVYNVKGIPVPFLTAAYALWRAKEAALPSKRFTRFGFWMVRPRGLITALVADALVVALRINTQFRKADQLVADQSTLENFAAHIRELRSQYRTVRVVAHSLGCAHVIHALNTLSPEERPDEVHLLAPAVSTELHPGLKDLSRRVTYLYHCDRDFTCKTLYKILKRESALGAALPRTAIAENIVTVDTSPFFQSWGVHRQYQNKFHSFAQ